MLSKNGTKGCARFLVGYLCLVLAMPLSAIPAAAAPGDTRTTPVVPMELPIEIEIELSPAGSLKQAPLWKELIQLLQNPYGPDGTPGTADDGTIDRRPSFSPGPDNVLGTLDDLVLPALNVFPLDFNFLTGQPMRLRTSDGEVSWDQPGPLFDPAEIVATDNFSSPTALRDPIGELVASNDAVLDAGEQMGGATPCVFNGVDNTCGYLIV